MTETYQKIFETGRRINELDNVLVAKINELVQTDKRVLEFGQKVEIGFDIGCIPEELRDLLKERQNIIAGKGEIYNHEVQEKEKKYFYFQKFKLEGGRIAIRLIKTWF